MLTNTIKKCMLPILILIFILFIVNNNSKKVQIENFTKQKNIICFLTVKPTEQFYTFCKTLNKDNYDVYICIDDNNHIIKNYDNKIPIIKYKNEVCEKAGFRNSVLWLNRACSRDKALYYFCKNKISYDNIWLLEEDVFFYNLNNSL